jgi:competence protein ComEA
VKRKKYLALLLIPLFFIFLILKIATKEEKTEIENIDSYEIAAITSEDEEEIEDEVLTENIGEIIIDIKGMVKNPGVYTFNEGARVNDAIKEAGGLLEGANTSLINLSKKLTDEMVIIIYSNDEIESLKQDEKIVYQIVEEVKECPDSINNACIKEDESTEENNTEEETKIVNINTATKEELLTLPGIGESKANNIINYRESFSFESIEQLKEVSGIGDALFEKVKDYITI